MNLTKLKNIYNISFEKVDAYYFTSMRSTKIKNTKISMSTTVVSIGISFTQAPALHQHQN